MSRKSRKWKEIIRLWRAEGYPLRKPTLANYRQGQRFMQRVHKDAKRDRAKWKRIELGWEVWEENE